MRWAAFQVAIFPLGSALTISCWTRSVVTLLSPRRSLLVLIGLVPVVAVPVLVVARSYELTWYAAAGLFYVALSVFQIGYFGILVLRRTSDPSPPRARVVEDEVRTPG